MSKFKECKSTITHNSNDNITILDTNLYIFAEAQSTGSHTDHQFSVWRWNDTDILIKEVGIHPND